MPLIQFNRINGMNLVNNYEVNEKSASKFLIFTVTI